MFSLRTAPLCLAASLACLASSPSLAADATLQKLQASNQLTIRYRQDAAPLSYADTSGKPTGYAIELCQRLASRLQTQLKLPNLQLRYVPVSIAERFDRIADGKIQLECADSTNTKARRERVAFGLPYYYAGARMLVRKDDNREQIGQMGRIAVIAGSTGQQVSERQRGATMVTVTSTEAGVKAVAEGHADAFVSDDIALIDQAMKDMYRDGTARQIYRKWFEQPLPARDYSLDLPPDRLLSDTFRRPDGFVTDWTVL
ncbi:MAG: transporter substrate-binding domain-containing protein [Alicycliphilus sp.]|nr:MAG: transporter substrate-binding domain-containing protein [Alicycliphilus sp.]